MDKQHILLFRHAQPTALGRLTLAGQITHGVGVEPPLPLRVFGSYGFTMVLRGTGTYLDALGREEVVVAGDLILVFPELAHTYSPPTGQTWDELYVVFGGPVFDLWRKQGVLDPRRPIVHLGDHEPWVRELQAVLSPTEPQPTLAELVAFLAILTRMLSHGSSSSADPALPWLAQARARLEADLHYPRSARDVAEELKLGYDVFRRRFTAATGESPAHYRLRHRVAAAAELLLYTRLSHAQIAERLAFADEFTFAKRFKAQMKVPPGEFRRRGHREEDRDERLPPV